MRLSISIPFSLSSSLGICFVLPSIFSTLSACLLQTRLSALAYRAFQAIKQQQRQQHQQHQYQQLYTGSTSMDSISLLRNYQMETADRSEFIELTALSQRIAISSCISSFAKMPSDASHSLTYTHTHHFTRSTGWNFHHSWFMKNERDLLKVMLNWLQTSKTYRLSINCVAVVRLCVRP